MRLSLSLFLHLDIRTYTYVSVSDGQLSTLAALFQQQLYDIGDFMSYLSPPQLAFSHTLILKP